MKIRNFIIKLISLFLIAGCLFYYQSVAATRAKAAEENKAAIAEVEKYNREILQEMEGTGGLFQDGIFDGEASGYGGPVKVSVTVKGGYIESIDVTEHGGEDPAYYALAEGIIDVILEEQSADVDTVSGATFSSTGIKNAVAEALKAAE